MKLHVLSDIHVEFEPFDPPVTDADVVVLAGDIHVGRKGLDWAREKFKDIPVIYVLGNHEYYGQALPRHLDKLRASAQGSNIHVLENDKIIIDEVVFLGATLWTDFRLCGDPRIAGFEATQKMTDYRKIRVNPAYRRLRPWDTMREHYKAVAWLKGELQGNKANKVVVVTHHAPSRRSVPEHHQDDILSAAYASNLDELVEGSGTALWIHGHLHAQMDYVIGDTRIVCNARGYPDEYNDQFVAGLVIEV